MTNEEWLIELDRLETFFKVTKLPSGAMQIGGYRTISKPESFISTNVLRARQNPGSIWQSACLFRLQQLEAYLLQNN